MLAGGWHNNKRIDGIRSAMHRGFDAPEKLFTEKLLRVEGVIDALLRKIELRLDNIEPGPGL